MAGKHKHEVASSKGMNNITKLEENQEQRRDRSVSKMKSIKKKTKMNQLVFSTFTEVLETGNKSVPNQAMDLQSEDEQTKSKKKQRKRKRHQENVTPSDLEDESKPFHEDSAIYLNRPSSPVLEGSMVNGMLVLIDRKAGGMYSSTKRHRTGHRVSIGNVDAQGNLVLSLSTTDLEAKSDTTDLEASDSNQGPKNNDPMVFPFETESDDHCESPIEAYEDIVPILKAYARRVHGRNGSEGCEQLAIYDPYYCNGRVATHLKSLGFPKVYNRKEDCYEVWNDDSSNYPSFDIFMTNPPYSGDHLEKLMKHVTSQRLGGTKPWMLLMPNFVHKKDFFQKLTHESGQQPVYVVPQKRYIYQPPNNFRVKKASDTHKKSSPFVSMWYLWGGNKQVTEEWYRILLEESKMRKQSGSSSSFDVARSKSALRDLRRKSTKKKE